MRGLRTGQLLLLLCVFPLAVPAIASADPGDAEISFCLSAAQGPALRETAQVLGLQPEADLAVWRRNSTDDFNRACEALYAVQKPAQPSWFANVLPFLTGLVGAMLGFVAAAWWDRVNRGRVLGDALRSAVKDFHEAADQYLRQWAPNRPDTEFVTNRRRLVHQLEVVRSERRKWPKPRRLVDQLTTGQFGESVVSGWKNNNTEATVKQREDCVGALASLHGDVLRVAAALAAPLSGRWRA